MLNRRRFRRPIKPENDGERAGQDGIDCGSGAELPRRVDLLELVSAEAHSILAASHLWPMRGPSVYTTLPHVVDLTCYRVRLPAKWPMNPHALCIPSRHSPDCDRRTIGAPIETLTGRETRCVAHAPRAGTPRSNTLRQVSSLLSFHERRRSAAITRRVR